MATKTAATKGTPRARQLDRLAQTHGWDTLPLRCLGASISGYLFTRGRTDIEVRTDGPGGRIIRAVRTAPGNPAEDPATARFEAAKRWLSAPPAPAPADSPARITRLHRSVLGSAAELVTSDRCLHCGGPINNRPITRTRPEDTDRWVHLRDSDWANDVHHATPAGGPITDNDLPAPWLITGDPRP